VGTHTLDGCSCPIHRDRKPVTVSLGLRFAERVHIESIPRYVAVVEYTGSSEAGEIHEILKNE